MELVNVHEVAKEIIGALMVWVAGRLGHKVQKAIKDLNCLFNRVRAIEERLGLDKKACAKDEDGCK